jgi:shikimate kinase
LLQTENPAAVLDTLMQRRYPVYAEADIVVESADQTPAEMVKMICEALVGYLDKRQGA